MSSLGCKTPVVIPAERTILFLNPGQTLDVTNSGVFMSLSLYQDYRRAVADKIQAEEEARGQK